MIHLGIIGAFSLAAATSLSSAPPQPLISVKNISPGVTLTQEIDAAPPLVINVLSVDLNNPKVRLGVEIGTDKLDGPDGNGGREEVLDAAVRHGAVAAVNGDFFAGPQGEPLGVGVKDGELYGEPWWGDGKAGPRVAMAVVDNGRRVIFNRLDFLGDLQTQDGSRIAVNGINRPVGPDQIMAYTLQYGSISAFRTGGAAATVKLLNGPLRLNKLIQVRVISVQTNCTAGIPLQSGEAVLFAAPGADSDFLTQRLLPNNNAEFVLAAAPQDKIPDALRIAEAARTLNDLPSRGGQAVDRSVWLWTTAEQALGGGPRLLEDGNASVDGVGEGFPPSFTDTDQPRTAVGADSTGSHVIIMTVDGRQDLSQGVTLDQMAALMKRYGAWNAINLDGGSSTAMAAHGVLVSSPPDGEPRRVAETLEVFDKDYHAPVSPAPNRLQLAPQTTKAIYPGDIAPLKLTDNGAPIPSVTPDIIWSGPAQGVGFIDQQGDFHAIKAGIAQVQAIFHGYVVAGVINVSAPVPTVHAPGAAETAPATPSAPTNAP